MKLVSFSVPFLFLFLTAALTSGGCSDRALYEFGRDVGRSKADCEALTSVDERAACEADFERDFETYERERRGA